MDGEPRDGAELSLPELDPEARSVLRTLHAAGHEAALVGGSLRDLLLGTMPADWDVATSARPEVVAELFPESTWLNRFGTVTVHGSGRSVQVTSYRAEGAYADRRRPDEVRFGVSLHEDLARRDFTINAIAWVPADPTGNADGDATGRLVDPHGGAADLDSRVLRAVGDPAERFKEDALRLLRAVRFASRFEMRMEAATEAAIRRLAALASEISGERVRAELALILDLPRPSAAVELMERLGLLAVLLPEVTALRGVPQAKAIPGDALDHTLRAVDAATAEEGLVRWTALLHDIGKATTLAEGHFIGHEKVGAELADGILDRLHFSRVDRDAILQAIRHHMYAYGAGWTDAAIRRFIRRVGVDRTSLLFALRRADNRASGVGAAAERNQLELERRIARELELGHPAFAPHRLAINGDDLQRELGLAPGPAMGEILDRLMEKLMDDPSLNTRDSLLDLARDFAAEGRQANGG